MTPSPGVTTPPTQEERFAMNVRVRDSIGEFMGPDRVAAIDAWMHGQFKSGPLRGRSPLGLVNEGRGQDVLDFIDAMRDGVFL